MVYNVMGETINVVMSSDMPRGMHEHVWLNSDDSFTVKLNAMYDDDTLRYALRHAIGHIIRGDFYRQLDDVNVIEAEAHAADRMV